MTIVDETYLQQLQEDQANLQTMLETRRHSLEGDVLAGKRMSASVRMLHQSYLMILEDALSILNSLIEYFTPIKAEPRATE